MCSIFVSTTTTNMDSYQGDLTDILRASSTANSGGGPSSASDHHQQPAPASLQQHHHDNHQWNNHNHQHHHHFSSSDNSMSFSSILQDPREGGINYFGDPFSTLRDPFLQELDLPTPTPTPSSYFATSTTNTIISTGLEQQLSSAATASSSSVFGHNKVVLEDPTTIFQHDMRSSTSSSTSRPCKNIFSNMIQISPNPNNTKLLPYDTCTPSPRPINKSSAVLSPNITINAANKDSLLDNNNTAGIQISSSRNTGLKRRKNQAKKVVCIPAPAAANSRQTGEVVPSDLWAWRKYGQKPIKGSPYPRGYYRCSSSKGCSARKQVERSRTDPNMLVITYTSEHNHPWPTQRNALAGSTRSQPSKSNPSQKNSETSQKGTKNPKEEENNNSDGNNNSTVGAVKEEIEDIEKQIEMDDGEFSDGVGILPYKSSSLMESNLPHEDFFAELGELESDPLNLLFNQGFGTNDHQKESKALDPFHLFDWSENSNNSNSFEEPNKRRL